MMLKRMKVAVICWVAVEELKLRYHNGHIQYICARGSATTGNGQAHVC